MTTIRRIMVIGAGRMGSGIAQTAAQAEIEVLLTDADRKALDASISVIGKNLTRQAAGGYIDSRDIPRILDRITLSDSISPCAETRFIIEAVSEQLAVKQELFRTIAGLTGEHVILATNTSSLSITEIGSAVDYPNRVIGMHFMNPVPKMKLVEIIKGVNTDETACKVTADLARHLGKEPIVVNDYPGFISNRLLMPMINEAIFCVYEGVADIESVDRIMQLGMNHPMGPLALADLIGLDICLAIMQILHKGFGDDKYRPCPLLINMVRAGKLGKKSGKGFYEYPARSPQQ